MLSKKRHRNSCMFKHAVLKTSAEGSTSHMGVVANNYLYFVFYTCMLYIIIIIIKGKIKCVSANYMNKIRLYIHDTYYPVTVTWYATSWPVGNSRHEEKRTTTPSCVPPQLNRWQNGQALVFGPDVDSSDVGHWETSGFMAVTMWGKHIIKDSNSSSESICNLTGQLKNFKNV